MPRVVSTATQKSLSPARLTDEEIREDGGIELALGDGDGWLSKQI